LTSLDNNLFSGFAEIALNSINLEWGWILLITGVMFFFISAYKVRKTELTDKLVNKSLIAILLTSILAAATGVGIAWLNIYFSSEGNSLKYPYQVKNKTAKSLIDKTILPAEKRIGALVDVGHVYAITCKANLAIYKKDRTGDCQKLSLVLDDIHNAGSIKNYSLSLPSFERISFQNKLKRMLSVSDLQEEMLER